MRALAIVTAVLAVAACSADAKDFQEQGATFIEGDEVRERLGDVQMSDAECEEPANTDRATRYGCTATGSDGNTWQFTIEITGEESLSIVEAAAVTPETTVAPTTAAPTTAAAPTTTVGPTTTVA